MNNKPFLSFPENIADKYKLSYYNLYLDEGKGLVYNTVTQAISLFDDKAIKDTDINELLENGFIVEKTTDELAVIKSEYESREQLSDEFHLILATTLACQFRCVYCYEQHPEIYMSSKVKQKIIDLVTEHASSGRNISIVWYGGEPMLDFETVQELSHRFMDICSHHGVKYSASMISNGFLFTRESIALLDALRIDSVQITVDGLSEVHEKRRPMVAGTSSFDRILENMILINSTSNTQVHLRINVDKTNIDSAHVLLEYCASKGLQSIDANLGMMKEFGCDHECSSCGSSLFSMREFSEEYLRFRDHAEHLGFHTAISKMFPEYKINSCTMDAPNAYVIDPMGDVYKCISQVGRPEYSIGNVQTGFDDCSHKRYNPFENAVCSNCRYFPICKGGCLLNNKGQTRECNVWRFITESLILREIDLT